MCSFQVVRCSAGLQGQSFAPGLLSRVSPRATCVRSPFPWQLCDTPLHTDATSRHPLAVTPTRGWWRAVRGVVWVQVSRQPSESPLRGFLGRSPDVGFRVPSAAASDGRHLSPQAPAGGRPPREDLVAASHPQPLPRALRPREPPCAHTWLLTSWPGCREAGEPSLGWSARPLVGGERTHELARDLGRKGGTLWDLHSPFFSWCFHTCRLAGLFNLSAKMLLRSGRFLETTFRTL